MREPIPVAASAAFEQLFIEHARVVYAHALRSTGSWATAEDVVSLTFLEAWRLRRKLADEVLDVRLWLLGIATNVLRNTARSARRHRAAMARLPERDPLPDFADEVVQRMADAQEITAATRVLDRLGRPEREVLLLCVGSGLGYAEAAAVLRIPVGTVRSRLSRARTRLRRLAREDMHDAGGRRGPTSGEKRPEGERAGRSEGRGREL